MERMTAKISTILVAVGRQTKVYRSVSEVPPRLRKKLLETTTGINAATILIADRGGREEIRKALDGVPGSLQTRMALARGKRRLEAARASGRWYSWRLLAEILLVGASGLAVWLAFSAG